MRAETMKNISLTEKAINNLPYQYRILRSCQTKDMDGILRECVKIVWYDGRLARISLFDSATGEYITDDWR